MKIKKRKKAYSTPLKISVLQIHCVGFRLSTNKCTDVWCITCILTLIYYVVIQGLYKFPVITITIIHHWLLNVTSMALHLWLHLERSLLAFLFINTLLISVGTSCKGTVYRRANNWKYKFRFNLFLIEDVNLAMTWILGNKLFFFLWQFSLHSKILLNSVYQMIYETLKKI